MQIDLTKVLHCEGSVMKLDKEVPLDDMNYGGQEYHFTKPAAVLGEIRNLGSVLELTATVNCEFVTNCDRCLKPITEHQSFELNEKLVRDENTTSYEDVCIFTGYTLDLTDIVLKSFLLNTSLKYLCTEDCKGLCPVCGADLNAGDCGCEVHEIDPRLAVLAAFKDDK